MTGAVDAPARRRILVIKLGALGDFILSYRAMTAIRAHHRDDHLTLLTIPSLEGLAEKTGLFDEIWTDTRPGWFDWVGWWRLGRRLNGAGFVRVYDLQTSDRSGNYFRLMRPPFTRARPEWSGNVRGCAYPHTDPRRETMHTLERQAEQLAIAGIARSEYPPLDFSWADADVSRHRLDQDGAPYVLLVPGGSAGRLAKRWLPGRYAELALRLISVGYRPVVLGTAAEKQACATIAAASPAVQNLCDDSPILDVMALARDAAGAVGNDTGPMHLIAAMGCPSLVLYSDASDPGVTRPRGPYEGPGAQPVPPGRSARTVSCLRRLQLGALTVDEVRGTMLLRRSRPKASH
jgi:ADP-heptose:LPS heptosyltransferase